MARVNKLSLWSLILAGLVPARLAAQAGLTPNASAGLMTESDQSALAGEAGPDAAVAALPPASPFQFGRLVLKPHVLYSFTDETGLLYAPGKPQSTLAQSASAGLTADFGQFWSVDYTPTWQWYSNALFHSALDQSASVAGDYSLAGWSGQLSQRYSESYETQIEAGGQAHQQTISTVLNGARQLGSELELTSVLEQAITVTPPNSPGVAFAGTSRTWSTTDGIGYVPAPQFSLGLTGQGGFTDITGIAQGYFAGPNGSLTVNTSDHALAATLSGGYLVTRYFGKLNTYDSGPTASASVIYEPFTVTSLKFTLYRNQSFSAFTAQPTRSTGGTLEVDQQVLDHLALDALLAATNSSFLSAPALNEPQRSDNVRSARVSLALQQFLKRGTVSAFWQFSRDNSDVGQYSFSSHQVGFEVAYTY